MKNIKRTSLQTEVIEYIKNYIEENRLQSGDKLPSQQKLQEMIGVSRPTLREAMKVLETRGVLKAVNGKGIFVTSTGDQNMISLLNFTKEKQNVLDVLEVRRILEKEIIRLVIHRATEEELDDLGETTRLLMQLFHEGKQQNHVDHKFHNTIYRLAHNDALYQLITSLETTMVSFWEYPLDLEDPFLKSIPLHEKLYFAIREKNVKKAQSINEKLLDEIEYEISQKY